MKQSRSELLRLQQEEEAYDASHGLAGKDAAPFVRPEHALTEAEEESSVQEEADSEEEVEKEEEAEDQQPLMQRLQQAQPQNHEHQQHQQQQQQQCPAGTSAGSSSDDDEPILAGAARGAAVAVRAATPEAAQRREAPPAPAATPAQERLRRQQQQQEQQQRRAQEEADREAGELARLLPQAAPSQPAGPGGGEGSSQHSPPGVAPKSWRRLAQQLVRKAGQLPQKVAPSGQAGPVARLPIDRVDALVADGLRPALPAMAAVLRAIGGATEVRWDLFRGAALAGLAYAKGVCM